MNENSDIDNSTAERTVDFEWAIRNQHNQLNCRFQITYNQLSYSYKDVRRSRKLLETKPPTKSLKIIEERSSQSDLHCVFAIKEADKREFLISPIRCGLPYNDNFTPDNIPT